MSSSNMFNKYLYDHFPNAPAYGIGLINFAIDPMYI